MYTLEVRRPNQPWKLFAKYASEDKAELQYNKFCRKKDGNKYRLSSTMTIDDLKEEILHGPR